MADSEVITDPLLSGVPAREGYKVLGGVALYQKIGQGGMGAVYKGRHVRLNIDVAVKIMSPPPGLAPDAAQLFVRRFMREAQTSAAIDHPNLVRTLDVNCESGLYFLTMQFVGGETASGRLRRKGPLPESDVVQICLGAAQGLGAAHRKGIVHRDIKPDNILLDVDGIVKVADLGLAKAFDQDDDEEEGKIQLTQTQQAMGTPSYMSPEQFESARRAGPRADVWSLGVTMYQLLTGQLPWRDSGLYAMMRAVNEDPLPDLSEARPDVSEGLREILDRCTRKNPDERYADATELAAALAAHRNAASEMGTLVIERSPDETAPTLSLAPPEKTLLVISESLDAANATPARPPVPADTPPSAVPTLPGPTPQPTILTPAPAGSALPWVIVLLLIGALGGGGWYFLAGPGAQEGEGPVGGALSGTEEGKTPTQTAPPPAPAPEETGAEVAKLVRQAESFRDIGELAQARDALMKALALAPDDAGVKAGLREINEKIAAVDAERQRKKSFEKWMEKALELKLSGSLAEAAQAYDEAATYEAKGRNKAVDAALRCRHQDAKAKAVIFEAKGDYEEAILRYEQALALLENPETRRALDAARTARDQRRAKEERAARYAEWIAKARKLRAEGRFESAAVAYESAVAFAEDGGREVRDALAVCRHDACKAQAVEAEAAGRIEQALALYARALGQREVPATRKAMNAAQEALKAKRDEQQRLARVRELAAKAEAAAAAKEPDKTAIRTSPAVPVKPPVQAPFYEDGAFEPEEAKRRQRETAERLEVPVEKTLDLEGGVTLPLVLIPAGAYTIGSRETPGLVVRKSKYRGASFGDEHPPHRVRITRPFYMGATEVTQAQYKAVTGKNPAARVDDALPVDRVTWSDTDAFAKALSKRIGMDARLPTEAEWEYACRAGTETPFHTGQTLGNNDGNYNGNFTYGARRRGIYRRAPLVVGKLAANAWGLYDMHGNVLEWCGDWYGEEYYSSSPADNPSGPAQGRKRVMRGGSWLDAPVHCRSARRSPADPAVGHVGFGLRIVVQIP